MKAEAGCPCGAKPSHAVSPAHRAETDRKYYHVIILDLHTSACQLSATMELFCAVSHLCHSVILTTLFSGCTVEAAGRVVGFHSS